MYRSTTDEPDHKLQSSRPEDLSEFLENYSDRMLDSDRPFTDYLRKCFSEKRISQTGLFEKAEIPIKYGYKLISGEKHTKERDIILRICLGAGFTLQETQTALKLYGMSPLYSRFKRDAVLISAISQGIHSTLKADELLVSCGLEVLHPCGSD